MDLNLKAFLSMIAVSEGTKDIGEDGYNIIVGSTKANPVCFMDYSDHPRIKVWIESIGKYSTAAGRYQVLSWIFDHYKKQLNLSGFWPDDQDKIAIQLIRECGALYDIANGAFDAATFKCRSRWASLPGAGYGQHENKLEALRKAFIDNGGIITPL